MAACPDIKRVCHFLYHDTEQARIGETLIDDTTDER